jgi:molecular chaperone DnaK
MPQIEVTFDIDANGILKVSAKDKATGKENNITIKANSGLTESEIEQMVKDAELNADADKKQRELIESRNTAEHQVWGVEKNLKEHGDKLTEEQKEAIESHLKLIKEAINGDDVDAIQKSIEESIPKFLPLMDIAQKAESEKQAAQPEVTPGTTEKTESKDDNIVDAEFTEKKD